MKQPPTASQTHSGAKQGPRHLALLPSPLLISAEWPEPGALCKAQQGPWSGKAWAAWHPSTGRQRACHSVAVAPALCGDNPHLSYIGAASGAGEEPPQK